MKSLRVYQANSWSEMASKFQSSVGKNGQKGSFSRWPSDTDPICSMGRNIFLLVTNNKKPKSKPNVGKYSMHGAFGDEEQAFFGGGFSSCKCSDVCPCSF